VQKKDRDKQCVIRMNSFLVARPMDLSTCFILDHLGFGLGFGGIAPTAIASPVNARFCIAEEME
jgi:hypothetical protein